MPMVSSVLTIIGNYAIPKIVQVSISTISNEYSFQTTPTGFTFSIWGLIYASLVAYSVAILFGTVPWDGTRSLVYGMSCLLNCFWIYLYTQKYFVAATISITGMVVSLLSIWWTNLTDPSYPVSTRKIVYQNALATYIGWICGAGVINVATTIHSDNNFRNSVLSILIVACIVAIQMTWFFVMNESKQARQESMMIPVVGLWTAVGIMLNGRSLGKLGGGVLVTVCGGILLTTLV